MLESRRIMSRFIFKTVLASLFLLANCGGETGSTNDGTSSNAGSTVAQGNNTVNSANCTANYTTSDLNGCFSPDNTGWLSYYCFDGVGGWYLEDWNVVAGCTGTIKSGTYGIQGCILTTCDNAGCDDQTIEATNTGILVGGAPYSSSKGCN